MQWRRLASAILVTLMVVSLGLAATASAQGSKKVTICHKGQTITVSENALSAHLGHGDYQGACEQAPPPQTDPDPDVEPEPEPEYVIEIVELTGAIVYYDPSMGLLRLQDGTILILYGQPDFAIQTGLMVLVRGVELPNGTLLVLFITTDVDPGDTDPNYFPVVIELTGEVSTYNAEYGTFLLDGVPVILVFPVDLTIEDGMLLTVAGQLLPDGRLLATNAIIYEPADDADDDGDDDADDDVAEDGNVTICHVPPGNSGNAHTITVGAAAVSAHLGHGDYRGACGAADDDDADADDMTVVEPVCDGPCNPILIVLADAFGSRYIDLAELHNAGYGPGEIARMYVLGKLALVEVSTIRSMREQGMSWDEILAQYPDVSPHEFVEFARLGNGRVD